MDKKTIAVSLGMIWYLFSWLAIMDIFQKPWPVLKKIKWVIISLIPIAGTAAYYSFWHSKVVRLYGIQYIKYLLPPIFLFLTIVNIDIMRIDLPVVEYKNGDEVYTNRDYFSSEPTSAMDGMKLVKLKRHTLYDVNIKVDADSYYVYRMLSPRNDNRPFDDWELTDVPVNVHGAIPLSSVVRKKYQQRKISIVSGWPGASCPILISAPEEADIIAWQSLSIWNLIFPGGIPLQMQREIIIFSVIITYLLVILFKTLPKHYLLSRGKNDDAA